MRARREDAFSQEENNPVDFNFLDALRRKAGCFRSRVRAFDDFDAELSRIGTGLECIRAWYKRYWEKLRSIAEQQPTSERALNKYFAKVEKGAQSLIRQCGLEQERFSYEALLNHAFGGCHSPHDCDEILR